MNRFCNLCRQIDELVLNDSKPNKALGEDLKALAVYKLEIEAAPDRIAHMKAQLDELADMPLHLPAMAKTVRRMRDNWEGALRTDQEIVRLRRETSYARTMKKKLGATKFESVTAELESEIAMLTSSNLERRATHLEYWAEYHPAMLAERYRREAMLIRHVLRTERAEQAHKAQLDKLDTMMALAEKVVIELDKRAKLRAQLTPLAVLARDVAAMQPANETEVEAPIQIAVSETIVVSDVAHEASEAAVEEPRIDPDLLAFMKIEGLDPEDPDHVALAAAMADPGDLEAARELAACVA